MICLVSPITGSRIGAFSLLARLFPSCCARRCSPVSSLQTPFMASSSQHSLKKYFTKVPKSSLASPSQPNQEANANHSEVALHSSQEFDLSTLNYDPGERTPILDYHPNHRDVIRRAYLQNGPCQPRLLQREDPQTNISGSMRRFNSEWPYIHQGGGEVFSTTGFKSWHKKSSLGGHIGLQNSVHNQSKKKCQDLLRQQQSVEFALGRQFNQFKHAYWVRLSASVDVVRLLVTQGFAFRGHDESKSSLSRVDESFDVSRKEKMAIVLRYIDRKGFVMERLIDIVHVQDTSALSLKRAIVNLLAQHSLSLSHVRGQCYDGASNMQGEINGLKMLIRQESRSAHSIHCFAHQLQLTLVAVSKKCIEVGKLVVLVSNILNVLGSSFERMDEFRDSQKERIQEALDMGELTTGRGLNQELDLSRACDTRWGSHYKSFKKFILMYGSIVNVLESLVHDARLMDERAKAMGYLDACRTYEVAFMLHLMSEVLAITNELNKCLQKKEQDLANAMLLLEVAKKRLQAYRDEEWDSLIAKVSLFCIKHDILVPNFKDPYVSSLRSRRRLGDNTESYIIIVLKCFAILLIGNCHCLELKDRFGK
ncbi:uncharacterized protein LOC132048979 [Lycium ferocissimum]|uniref:uncharacterized protein LOC132048979 n=1 Tax=Lycium ferocissimum TaxID=112874 RepID=UPI0028163158|nr:uncharacterized protein LOC132048979 [Lycium ferocissimum]